MNAKRPWLDDSVKTPGVSSTPDIAAEVSPAADGPLVMVTQAQLDRMVLLAAAQVNRTRAADVVREADLPDQGSVDPRAISEMILTKQGWIVPVGRPGQNRSL